MTKLDKAFNEILKKRELTDIQKNDIESRVNHLKDLLLNSNLDINLEDFFLSGSYPKKLLIKANPEKYDIDIIIVLGGSDDLEYENRKPKTIIEKLENFLIEKKGNVYNIPVRKQKKSIGIEYGNFKIDIVIFRKKDNRLEIADRINDKWMISNVKCHLEEAKKYNAMQKKVIKLFKIWKKNKIPENKVSGIKLELLIYQNYTIGNETNLTTTFYKTFESLSQNLSSAFIVYDSCNQKLISDEISQKNKENFKSIINQDFLVLQEAINEGKLSKVKSLFGEDFPELDDEDFEKNKKYYNGRKPYGEL